MHHSKGLRYYPFAANFGRRVGCCNTLLNDLSNKVCTPNKAEYLNVHVFNIAEINESKILAKKISCECKSGGRKCNSNKKWNSNKCRCEYKNPKEHHVYKKDYIWNHATCGCKNENGKYVGSYIHDSVIMCDETLE